MNRKGNFKPIRNKKLVIGVFLLAFATIGGIIALLNTYAAVTLVPDSSVPAPQNIQVFPDDQSIYVRWDDRSTGSTSYGYYIKYRKKNAVAWENVRQTIHNTIQLQPLQNGQEYEITVQTARGSNLGTALGPLKGATDAPTQYWFRADGHVSPVTAATTVSSTPSAARVDAMRNRLTGFFDDFNEPANPLNELKWNSATTGRSDVGSNGTFINAQFHAHTQLRSGFGGLINRPRATFKTSVGVNNSQPLSESNPARVEWDMDIVYDGRSNWYVDLIPLSVRRNKQTLDINAHDQNDLERGDEPANMLRMNVTPYIAEFEYWDSTFLLHKLPVEANPAVACRGGDTTNIDFRDCDLSQKTPGLSPLQELSDAPFGGDQNVRRHFIMEITPTRARVYMDSALLMESVLPAAFASQREFTVHNSMFTYNTGKEWGPTVNGSYEKKGIHPIMHFYHWDNFGFTGPVSPTVIHNYIDGGETGTTPKYFQGEADYESGIRTTTIPIPDDIGSPVGGKAKLYWQEWCCGYRWRSGDHILVNGHRYNVPNPLDNMVSYPSEYTDSFTGGGRVHSVAIEIDATHLLKGNNRITNNMQGAAQAANFTEPHIELEYAKSGQIPTYTPPIAIFGQTFSNIVEPHITNCDYYIYTEQDINLPYLGDKQNLSVGECAWLPHNPLHHGVGALLDIRNFEAEHAYSVTPEVTTIDDPNASNGKYIRF